LRNLNRHRSTPFSVSLFHSLVTRWSYQERRVAEPVSRTRSALGRSAAWTRNMR